MLLKSMTLKAKTVLVTGGTGSIGGRLVEKLFLEQQANVRVLVRNFSHASRIARFPIEMVGGDITQEASVDAAVRGCEVVFHCAYDFGKSQEQQERVGVVGTENVVKAVLKHKVGRLVHISSISVYEPTADGDLDEMAPKELSGWTYADTKLSAEELVLDYCYHHGLPVAVVQPTIVYGPFVRSWTIGPVRQLTSGRVILVDNGSGYCNAVYIDDVIDAMILAATKEQAVGETFLISGAEPISWQTFFSAYEKVLDLKTIISMTAEKVEKMLRRQESTVYQALSLMWDPNRLLRMPLSLMVYQVARNLVPQMPWQTIKRRMLPQPVYMPNRQKLALYRSRTHVRIDKARRLLGYEPVFDFERGMALTARFIRWANLV